MNKKQLEKELALAIPYQRLIHVVSSAYTKIGDEILTLKERLETDRFKEKVKVYEFNEFFKQDENIINYFTGKVIEIHPRAFGPRAQELIKKYLEVKALEKRRNEFLKEMARIQKQAEENAKHIFVSGSPGVGKTFSVLSSIIDILGSSKLDVNSQAESDKGFSFLDPFEALMKAQFADFVNPRKDENLKSKEDLSSEDLMKAKFTDVMNRRDTGNIDKDPVSTSEASPNLKEMLNARLKETSLKEKAELRKKQGVEAGCKFGNLIAEDIPLTMLESANCIAVHFNGQLHFVKDREGTANERTEFIVYNPNMRKFPPAFFARKNFLIL